ncbi:MAG TPA: peptide chain release factor N(5)-glutamine methyltransferase [Atribacter sp.]|uniref:peptide chain release factor N(5)-glutamine methyltransferase n=1 Tax=Atribacter sp. TaxID=2847780 RepID=UPI002C4720B7|nr:peptide chain release factor N(5)-glutamine methyltransferase [Atribacter sp.]HQK83095.1 peptide chain release factor N(5)-glutamine methyltransferase [Atribacter sp.]
MSKVRDVWSNLVLTLRKHNLPGASREARFLLSGVLSASPSHIYLYWDQDLSVEKIEKLNIMIKERLDGVPLQYILKEWEFFSLQFYLEKGVFIPRLDTESWLEEAIITIRSRYENQPVKLCDLCCGSGVIGLTVAYWLTKVQVVAIDRSKLACDLTQHNAQKLGLEERISVWQSDLFNEIQTTDELQFDFILSNPPYVKEEEWNTLSPEIRLHEPKDALVSGSEGLDLIYRTLNESSPYLKSQGYLYIEHDPSQVEAIADLSLKTHFKKDHVIFDYQKRPRATVFRRN